MISDTLSDAAHNIRRYLREKPEMYAEIANEIEALLAEMDRIRIILDTPPREQKETY